MTTKFDIAVSKPGVQRNPHFRDAAVEVNDTLVLCCATAQSVFGKDADPRHAIALLPLVIERADAKRRQEEAEALAHTPGEASPPPNSAG